MTRSDDQRMRRLVDRLVAMSPEPPEYPEEMIMTTPQKTSRRSPALVFAGAAVLVLLGAAIPLLLMGDPEPVAPAAPTTTTAPPTTETTTPTDTTVPAETTTVPTTIVEPPAATHEAVVYLIQDPVNSFTGDPALVPLLTTVTGEEDAFTTLLALQLLTDPDLLPPPEFDTVIPPDVAVVDVREGDGDVLVVDMNESFLGGAGGLLADITMLNQLVFTATQPDPEARVQFTVGGEPIETYGTEGLDLSEPIGREDFLDHVNLVILTSPVVPDDTGRVTVSGLASVFEATVNLQVVDQGGAVLYEDFTTATTGGPDWGEYSHHIDHDFAAIPGIVRVFWYSAEDGEPSNVVTVPVTPDGSWSLLPEE